MTPEGPEHLNIAAANVPDTRDAIQHCLRTRQAFLLHGAPGIGKTTLIREAAERNGYAVQTVNLAHMDYTAAHGARWPDVEAGITRQLFPDFMPRPEDPKTVVFFDEFGSVELEASRRPVAQLVLEGRIGLYRLDPKHRVALATNLGAEDGVMNLPLDPMLADRLVHLHFEPDEIEWIRHFAAPKGLHPAILGYIKSHPTQWNHFRSKASDLGQVAMATPRSWNRAHEHMAERIAFHQACQDRGETCGSLEEDMQAPWFQLILGGLLSRPVQTEFCAFFESSTGFAEPDEVLKAAPENRKALLPRSLAGRWTFAAMLHQAVRTRMQQAGPGFQGLLREFQNGTEVCMLQEHPPKKDGENAFPAREITAWSGNMLMDTLFRNFPEPAPDIVQQITRSRKAAHRNFRNLIDMGGIP